jgi:hypothetical protein
LSGGGTPRRTVLDGCRTGRPRRRSGRRTIGVGAAEVERRVLTEAQVEHIVRAEMAEREAAARDYDRAGRPEHAERLRYEAGVLSAHLAERAG